jgi:SAM-dependent methyltransferase
MGTDVWHQPAAQRYDASSAHMYASEVLGPTVDFLAQRAGGGPALEFAIGTGRVALPLRARGVPVAGIELSESMVAELRNKPGGGDIPVAIGDMATTRVPGPFVIEVFVPDLQRLPPGETARPFHLGEHHLGFDTFDLVNQQLVSHHYWIKDGTARTFRSPHRFVWPSELDLMAKLAGLELRERWADWHQTPFTAASTSHVSVWQKPHGEC